MSYDPKSCGAQCDLCPLQGKTVVPPELPTNRSRQSIVILGEAPGEEEEKTGRPFVGPSGNELGRALRAAQINRHESLVTNTLLCRPDNNDLETFIRKAKKKAAEEGVPFHHPIECCKPRLTQEIKGYINFITLGKIATHAVAGTTGGILKIRGGFMELEADMLHPYRRVMPTVHPAFVLRQQKWRHVFRNDIFKAARWFRGASEWKPPEMQFDITPEEVDAWLTRNRVWGYDLETDGIEPLTARIRCISFATADEGIVITLMSLEPGRKGHKVWPKDVENRYIEVFKKHFEDPTSTKVAHNGLTYDNPVMKAQWGIIPVNVDDTLLVHKGVESELSHSLGYVVSLYTEAPSWKHSREGDKLSTDSESDRQLAEYCLLDSSLMMRVYPPLMEQLRLRDQVSVYHVDRSMQVVCASMHEVGMYVDEAARMAKEQELLKKRWETLKLLREHPDVHAEFNPSSVYQIRDLLFEKWKLVPDLKDEDRLTASEDPSTADLVLRALLTDSSVPKDKRDFIKILRRFRKLIKVLGTYVLKMRRKGIALEEDLGWDEDDDWVDRETRKRYGLAKEGIVDPRTFRMHPGYSAALPVTGRISSFKPMNCFDMETEILTESGWSSWADLKDKRVAQWDSGVVSFVKPTAYHHGLHCGPMVELKNSSNALRVTGEHRLLVDRSGRLEVVLAQELTTLRTPGGNWNGLRSRHAGYYDGPGIDLTDDQIRLMIALQADASFSQGRVDFGVTKERKWERITHLLNATQVEFKVYPRVNAHRCGFRIPLWTQPYLTETKEWKPSILHLSEKQARVFIEELWFWDGHHKAQTQYGCVNKTNVDLVSALLSLHGVSTTIAKKKGTAMWYVNAVHRDWRGYSPRSQVIESVVEGEPVWCVTVPSSFVIVRRHGKVSIVGQSMNYPGELRSLVTCSPGNILVGADMDQLELRVAAALWDIELYKRAFREGKDPHSMTAYAVFGEEYLKEAGIEHESFFGNSHFRGAAFDEHGVFDKNKASKNAVSMRGLSKAVQYACVDKDEHVIILGEEGSKPISELTVGEWTWCWSRERRRYEPAEITAVMPRGEKSCVRVTFEWWGGSRKGRCTESIVVTTDHLCLLRDGSFREAGTLRPDDRLMPFRRRENGQDRVCHRVMPFNDSREYRKAGTHRRGSVLDPLAERIGHEPDRVIAKEVGVTPQSVYDWRRKRGVPAYWKEAPGGNNHRVVSVEPVGMREVWDIEVDHEDHNFALAAGIFVHNSQYKGSVETVHKLVCKTEVPAINPTTGKPFEDGTTDLPYALMKLRRVREMRDKWLQGAPEFETGWEKEITEYRIQGFLRDPVHGRRRDFMDGEDPNQIVNFKIQCHEGSTRVLTDLGWVPIRELVGEHFLAWTGHKWAPAIAIWKGRAPIYQVTTQSDFRVLCDGSHGLKVQGESEYLWRAVAGEGLPPLRANDIVAMSMAAPLEFPRGSMSMGEEEAWVLGFWVGNGSTYKSAGATGVKWTVGHGRSGRRDIDYLYDRLRNFIEAQQWHLNVQEVPHSSISLTATRDHGSSPQDWLRKNFADPCWTSHTKRVPISVLRGSLAVRRAFLRGLLDADGYMSPCGKVTLHMCQRPLLEDVALVARTLGIPPNFLHGPYAADRKGHTSWRLALNAARCKSELAWGVGGKLRTKQESSTPVWELKRVLPELNPTCDSDKVVRSRIKVALDQGKELKVSPYMLQRMGASRLYDHQKIARIDASNEVHDVFTLCVQDEEHQYVAEGFISKNSGAAGLMNTALIRLYDEIERRKKTHNWGPHTGVINQCHDSIVIECPEKEEEIEWTKNTLEACMNQTHPALPGVVFSASATVGKNWKKVG